MRALLLTLLTGIFFLIGIFINKLFKSNKLVESFSIGMSFIVLFNIIFFDIVPEIKEFFDFKYFLIVILGFSLLKILDFFVPDHNHHHKEKLDNIKEHNNHQTHLGVITILALLLHNIIENMVLYNITLGSFKNGLVLCLGIGLHNIPLGFQIESGLKGKNKFKVFILTMSGFIGGLICYFFKSIPLYITNYLLSFTLGMLIYLCFFELLKELFVNRKNKGTYFGIGLGIILIIILHIL